MFNLLTSKNKKDLTIYFTVSFLLAAVFLTLAYFSWTSFFNYRNRVAAPFYSTHGDYAALSSTPLTGQLIIVVIDGLTYDDSLKLDSIKNVRTISSFTKIKALTPTLSQVSWATLMTGATPEIHGVLNPDTALTPKVCENIVSIARERAMRTAIFGHSDWQKIFGEYASLSYYREFNPSDTDTMDIDSDIMSNAMSFIKYQKPHLTVINLPGLDRTTHLFGRGTHEFNVHIEKLDSILAAFLKVAMANNRYAIITSSHGHLEKGGHGGAEPEVTDVPLVIVGPKVEPDKINMINVKQTDVCATASSILGLAVPFFSVGSFIDNSFAWPDYIKIFKVEATILQKSRFYSEYTRTLGWPASRLYNAQAVIDDIKATTSPDNYNQRVRALEIHSKKIDMEFENTISESLRRDRIFRFAYLFVLAAAFFAWLIYRYRHPYRLFSALALTVIFYSIYYGLYFLHGHHFSLSDIGNFENAAMFLKTCRVEIFSALILTLVPLLLNYFVYQKRLYIWLNYVFFPVFIEFNMYLLFTLVLQCFYYIGLYGASPSYVFPEQTLALKYYFDAQIIAVTQMTSFGVIFILYSFLYFLTGAGTPDQNA